MKTFAENIASIRSARYGEEVRESIASSLEQSAIKSESKDVEYVTSSFIRYGNLINKSTCVYGHYYNYHNGVVGENAEWFYTNPIKVEKDRRYPFVYYGNSNFSLWMSQLNIEGEFIKGNIYSTSAWINHDFDENTAFIVLSSTISSIDDMYLGLDTMPIKDLLIDTSVVIPELDFGGGYSVVVGSANAHYYTIQAAIESVPANVIHKLTKNYEVNIYIRDGVYNEQNLTLPDHFNLIGLSGDPDKVIINGYLDPSTDASVIAQTSTINIKGSNKLYGLTVTAKNMRYPIHSESNGLVKDWVQKAKNCRFIHYGNEEAISHNPNVWKTYWSWGEGASSGSIGLYEHCEFISVMPTAAPFYVHDADGFTKPVYKKFIDCNFIANTEYYSVFFNMLRTDKPKTYIDFIGCTFAGSLYINCKNTDVRLKSCSPTYIYNGNKTALEKYGSYTDVDRTFSSLKTSDVSVGDIVSLSSGSTVRKALSSDDASIVLGIVIRVREYNVDVLTSDFIPLNDSKSGHFYGIESEGTLSDLGTTKTNNSLYIGIGSNVLKRIK